MAAPALGWVPETETGRCAVREQLERILSHPVFRGSKRSAALLRHVVQYALDGHIESLKERTLGMEVFGRDPDYDTNLDPVVRTAAGEVRKRIAQYYHVDGHEHELRIDLPAGSYIPEFRFPVTEAPQHAVPSLVPDREEPKAAEARRRKYWPYVVLACAVLLLVAGIVEMVRPQSASQKFWGPVLRESSPILITLGDPKYNRPLEPGVRSKPAPPEMTLFQHELQMEVAAVSDVVALAEVDAFLARAGRTASVRDCLSTTFSDLQRGPNVLIAGFDNPWTLRAVAPLRFRLKMDHSDEHVFVWIEDAKNPATRDWMVDLQAPYTRLSQDYAIVARFRDSTTGQVTVIEAGLAENGTMIAGEFLTNPKYLEVVNKMAPKGWENKNFEGVIATQVIDGKSGPPRLVALETW